MIGCPMNLGCFHMGKILPFHHQMAEFNYGHWQLNLILWSIQSFLNEFKSKLTIVKWPRHIQVGLGWMKSNWFHTVVCKCLYQTRSIGNLITFEQLKLIQSDGVDEAHSLCNRHVFWKVVIQLFLWWDHVWMVVHVKQTN